MTAPEEEPEYWELYSMLNGLRKWNPDKVAATLRSCDLPHVHRLLIMSCLADLIDGTAVGGRKLKMVGSKKRFHILDARAEHDRYIGIGRWVQSEIDNGETHRAAIAGAEDQFGVSESTAQRALSIFRDRLAALEKGAGWYPLPTIRKPKQSR
jgi:hypothetical protein